jgi:hypothetical protein
MLIASRRAVQHVVALVLFEVMAVGGLHALGTRSYLRVDWFHISRWLAATPTDQVVVSLVWLGALVLGWWTLGSTLLYLLTRVRGFRAGARIAERLAPSAIRQVIDRALATTVVTSVLLGTAAPALANERPAVPITQQAPDTVQYEPDPAGTEGAESEPPSGGPRPQGKAPKPVERPRRDGRPEDAQAEDAAAAELEAQGRDGGEDAPEVPTEAPAEAETAPSEAATGRPAAEEERTKPDTARNGDRARDDRSRRRSMPHAGHRYTVRAGDHLWKIAVAVVSADGDGARDRNAVASYWAELVRVATPHLESGDPNLIYPGEELELPPLRSRTGDRK